jgi:hypothetical protein
MEIRRTEWMALLAEQEPWLEERCAWRAEHMDWVEAGELVRAAKDQFEERVRRGALEGVSEVRIREAAHELMRTCLDEVVFYLLLTDLSSWLLQRCRHKAAQIRRRDVEPRALFHAVLARALERARGSDDLIPWFDQAPITGIRPQARALFHFCLLQEFSAIVSDPLVPHPTPGEGALSGQAVAASDVDSRPRYDAHVLPEVLEVIDGISTPPRRLAYLSRDFPGDVDLERLCDAKSYTRGGARIVLRSPEESLTLLRGALSEFYPATKHRPWTLILGGIYYSTALLEDVSFVVRKNGAEAIETYARSVVRALIKFFEAQQRTTP